MTFTLIPGDCIEAMQAMAENSVDAIVTDPPYGLEFMGKEWDNLSGARAASATVVDAAGIGGFQDGNGGNAYSRSRIRSDTRRHGGDMLTANRAQQEWHHAWATEALRILKPGGHLLAFGGTRTYHRLACAIEDAGFEIRDCLAWMYGSGFPKSLDVSKAIDKAAGAEREVVGVSQHFAEGRTVDSYEPDAPRHNGQRDRSITAPATPEAQRWNGWGTALKPAFEPIVLARKPLAERNVAANVQRWGTGALNIDGCRVGTDQRFVPPAGNTGLTAASVAPVNVTDYDGQTVEGRWPANVTLDETAAAMLDEQTGERPSRGEYTDSLAKPGTPRQLFGQSIGTANRDNAYANDTGGASRFFYCPKADPEERNRGLAHMAHDPKRRFASGGRTQINGEWVETHSEPIPSANTHPTVKPVELMRWLCRMVTPKGGTVLDPFTGSGSTGVAAMREGFEFIGIEQSEEYVEIARARIIGDAPLFNQEVTA